MANRKQNDDTSRNIVTRRNYVKFLGAATTSLAAVGANTPGATAAKYKTVTVRGGESRQFSVRDGETLENLLIDITADGADARIVARGNDWTIRNVGFRGKNDRGWSDGFSSQIYYDGTGTIENVYLGNGAVEGTFKGAMGGPSSHSGTVTIRNCYIAEWTDNAIYNAHTADNGRGTLRFENSYFRDNNTAHLRIAADGTVAENCVIHNTNSVPSDGDGEIFSSGVYTGYGTPDQVVEIRNCDVAITDENTGGSGGNAFTSNDEWHSEMSTIRVVDTQYVGDVMGPYVEFAGDNGSNPDLSVPTGVPTTPEGAASRASDGPGSPSNVRVDSKTPSSVTVAWDAPQDTGAGLAEYRVYLDGNRYASVGAGQQRDTVDGLSPGTSHEIAVSAVDSGGNESPKATITATSLNVLTVSDDDDGEKADYEVTVSGSLEKSVDNGATVDDHDAIDGSTATGHVYGGTDSYRFSGEVTGFSADGEVTVYLNGNVVDPSSL